MILFLWAIFSLITKNTVDKNNNCLNNTSHVIERKYYQDSIILFRDTVNKLDTIHIYVKKGQKGDLPIQLHVLNQTNLSVVFYLVHSRSWFVGSISKDTIAVNQQTPLNIMADLNYINFNEDRDIFKVRVYIDIKGTLNRKYRKTILFMIHRQ